MPETKSQSESVFICHARRTSKAEADALTCHLWGVLAHARRLPPSTSIRSWLPFGLLASIILLSSCSSLPEHTVKASRPNIVVILADDLG